MKIAHISDLHIDKTYKRNNYLKTLRLFEYISDNNFDHVIISGDITENAEASAFEIARNLFKRFGLLDAKKLTLTIGNHDIFGGVHLAEDVINFPKKCKVTDYDAKVKEFEKYFAETFTGTIRNNKLFPYIKEFDEFALISLNSIARYSILKNPFASNGEISDKQMKALWELLIENDLKDKKKIVVTHHHFCKNSLDEDDAGALWKILDRQTMKLRGKKHLMKQFKKMGVELVLHGHVHESNHYKRRNIKFINSGGSILSGKNDALYINNIEINSNGITNDFIKVDNSQVKSGISNTFSLSRSIVQLPSTSKNEICLN